MPDKLKAKKRAHGSSSNDDEEDSEKVIKYPDEKRKRLRVRMQN